MARTIRQQIKQPDAFQILAGQGAGWIESHAKGLLIGGAALLLAVAGTWGYRYWAEKNEEKASIAYMLALEAEGPQEAEALRRTALAHPRTRGGVMARLDLARALREGGEHAGAEQEYQILLGSAAAQPLDRELAQRGLAATLELQGKCPDAITLWREIIGRGSLLGADDLYVQIANCEERAGDPRAAARTLEEFSQKFPQSPFLTEVLRERMDRLAGPAAKAPAAPAQPQK
ncbi:MAG: tetratricopeptide repeat protein [Nitrospinota bacterium]